MENGAKRAMTVTMTAVLAACGSCGKQAAPTANAVWEGQTQLGRTTVTASCHGNEWEVTVDAEAPFDTVEVVFESTREKSGAVADLSAVGWVTQKTPRNGERRLYRGHASFLNVDDAAEAAAITDGGYDHVVSIPCTVGAAQDVLVQLHVNGPETCIRAGTGAAGCMTIPRIQ